MIADSVPAAEAIVWTMLFSWMVEVAERLEHRHRDHRGRDRRREGDPDLEAEIDVGGGEDDGDQRAEDDPAERQFLDVAACAQRRLASPSNSPLQISSFAHVAWRAPASNGGGSPASGRRPYTQTSVSTTQSSIIRPRYLTRHLRMDRADHHLSSTVASRTSSSIASTSRRWIASSHSSRSIMNGPVERVPISTKSG